jgi:predicted metalloprotease
MKWTPGGSNEDIEDRRDSGGGGIRGPHVGIGGLILLGVLSFVFKRDLISPFLGTDAPVASTADPARTQAEQPQVEFVTFVFNDVQRTMEQAVSGYRRTKLVLFRDLTESACGSAESATGPFYCPGDEKVYIDLGFYDELKRRFGAPGQFAQAYVLAHEVGHHVQKLLGTEAKVRRLQQANPGQANPLSVRMELQADCYAGVWAHSTDERKLLEAGDVESGLGAAAAVGDDRIARMSRQQVSPERFTHGSSAQRVQWFKTGMESGSLQSCDTFSR